MSRTKKTHFALLGLLSWKPMSGYDIKKIVDVGLSHFWNENYGQIYPTLDSLVDDGLAKKSLDPRGKRKRHLYRITPRGETAFHQWLEQPADPPRVRNEFQLKFFLSSKLPLKTSLRIVQEHRVQQQEVLQEYRASEVVLRKALDTGEYPEPVEEIFSGHRMRPNAKQKAKQCNFFLLTLRQGIRVARARVAWCDEVIDYFST